MGMGFAPTWLRRVSPSPLLHKVSMSSLDVMLLVSSQLDTYIAEECKMGDGGTLSVNSFEFWQLASQISFRSCTALT